VAMYLCFECQELVDDDWHPCEVHPSDDTQFICPSCVEKYNEEYTEYLDNHPHNPINRM
jgi:RNA polymerase subunit RPABC4/transcription elongation factor Spt4